MRIVMAAALAIAALGASGTAHAQSAIEARVDRLEREMRAVQRKVFPGGAGQTVEPQIVPQSVDTVPGLPASAPIADLTQRIVALESQVATLTGQVEQTQYRLRTLEDGFTAYKRGTDARIKALEDKLAAPPAPAADAGTPPATTAASGSNAARAQKVAAVARPTGGDPAEDSYIYGFRLWEAGLYPEARKELQAVATKFPKHRRASFAQNLLGRAYYDDGQYSDAAVAFYNNFKTNPNGERAPDSLYYLAQTLTKLKKPSADICRVYDELLSLYSDRISDQMKADVAAGRTASKCK